MTPATVSNKTISRSFRNLFYGAVALAALAWTPVAAQGADPTPPADFASGADALKPGQYIWTPDAAPAGRMVIYVDLSRQLAAVYRGGVRIGVSTISSGREGYQTPTGVFAILGKDAKHRSNKYDDAPMPFQERLTWDGVALHAGRVPGYPESHGCVHLPYSFAKALFKETRIGATVVMSGEAFDGDRTPKVNSTATTAVASTAASPVPLDDASPHPTAEFAAETPVTPAPSRP